MRQLKTTFDNIKKNKNQISPETSKTNKKICEKLKQKTISKQVLSALSGYSTYQYMHKWATNSKKHIVSI